MQWSKVKNILIVILLVVNGFLLFNLGSRYVREQQRETELYSHIETLLLRRGIEMGDEFRLPKSLVLPMLKLERSRVDEEQITKNMFGEDTKKTEDDEGSVLIKGENGSLTWGADGTIAGNYTLDTGSIPQSEADVRAKAKELFSAWGLRPSDGRIEAVGQIATLTSDVAAMPVHNRYISLFFEESGMITITGFWTFSVPYSNAQETGVLCSAEDAVFAFLDHQPDIGAIESMTLGYRLQPDSGRRLQMLSTWKIETDAGTYYVDCAKKTII